jgi:translation elongation factor P/translation initiation factor 5A
VLQDLLTGAKKEVRIKSAEKVEIVDMSIKECTVTALDGKGNVTVAAVDDEDDVMTIPAGEGHLIHYLKPGKAVLWERLTVV